MMDPSVATIVPCSNFSMIAPGVYRSGYPSRRNFMFLKTLGIRSICYLCPEEYALVNQDFYGKNGIGILQFPMEGNKEPFVNIPEEQVNRALSAICDTRHHPILIHCNKGKHRTGAVCGCLRRIQGWSLVSIIDEYNRFAGDKSRAMDQQFVELFRPRISLHMAYTPEWLSLTDMNPLYAANIISDELNEEDPDPIGPHVQFLTPPCIPSKDGKPPPT